MTSSRVNISAIQDLRIKGFSVIAGGISQTLVDTLRSQCEQVLSALPEEHREKYKSQGSLLNFGDYPEFSHLIAHPAIQSLLEGVGATDIRWLAGYLISKPPWK